jgi:hypothetical protein
MQSRNQCSDLTSQVDDETSVRKSEDCSFNNGSNLNIIYAKELLIQYLLLQAQLQYVVDRAVSNNAGSVVSIELVIAG